VIGLAQATDEDKTFAHSMIGICFGLDPNPATARHAIAFLGMDANGALTAPKSETAGQRRARALVLAFQKDRASKLAAIRILEADRDTLPPADRFLLVQMHAQVGDRPAVRLGMTELLRKADRNTLFIAFFAEWLLDQGDWRDAELWVTKLEKAQPEAFRTVALKVRLQGGKKDLPAARTLLRTQLEKTPAAVGVIAALAEDAGLYPEAEDYFKKFVGMNEAKRPEAAFVLAKFYARRDRLDEALAVCAVAWTKCPPPLAGQQSLEVLALAPKRDAKQLGRVEEWITAALAKPSPADTALRMQLAYLRSLQQDHDQAIRIYTELASGANPDPVVLNNLAYLLSAHRNQHDEALKLLERAKTSAGALPDLLDTEALIHLARGKVEDLTAARRLLEDVVALAPSSPAYFHLARLEQKCGNILEMNSALREAVKRKLTPAELHPLEQAAWREMEKKLMK